MPQPRGRISHIAVLGERHSGTNYLEKMLRAHLDEAHEHEWRDGSAAAQGRVFVANSWTAREWLLDASFCVCRVFVLGCAAAPPR